MTRTMYRKTALWRSVAVAIALVFATSATGVGYAAPARSLAGGDGTARLLATAPKTVSEPPASQVSPAPSEEGPSASVEPRRASKASDTKAKTATRSTSARKVVSSNPKLLGAGAAAKPSSVPRVGTAAPSGGGVQLTLEGYRLTPHQEWTTGNLGSLYREGDWVPYRLIIDNSGGSSAYSVPSLALKYDHYNNSGGKNAVGVDMTRFWRVYYTSVQPGDGDAALLSGTAITPSFQDAPFPSGSFGSSDFLRTGFPAGTVVIPAGQYAVVYFQAHLSLTAWWLQQSPARNGSGFYPGSSMQMRADVDGVGDKTVPIPIPPKPESWVDGMKFNDLDRDGIRDAGEPGLAGWEFHLHDGPEGFPLDLHAISAADGKFTFGPLPEATYALSEEPKAGWVNSTPLPMTLQAPEGERVSVAVGNYRPDVTKTFRLDIDNAPAGTEFFVRYVLSGGQPVELQLLGSGPYSASAELPFGSTITSVMWFATYGGQDILLGSSEVPEELTGDITNSFDYSSSVSGFKFGDIDADGVWDEGESGLAGWAISLYRVGEGPELYAQTVTGPDGSYTFEDVLPGTYFVTEGLLGGWFMTVGPEGVFEIGHGSQVAGLNFGNVEVDAAISIEKMGPALAHVGDTINYHIVVTNVGNTPLFSVVVSDPMLGGTIAVIPELAPGESMTFHVPYTVPEGVDPIDNTASAMGYDLLQGVVADDDSWTVDVIHPAIEVLKAAEPAAAVAGTEITYTFTVTNTGDVTLFGVMVHDDRLGHVGEIAELGAGESVTLTASAVLTETTTNVVVATGYDPTEFVVSDSDELTVPIYNPGISILKSASATVVLPGTEVTYFYTVTNTGDIALFNVAVTDDILGPIGMIALLAPGESVILTASGIISADTVNVATVFGHYGSHEEEAVIHGHVTAEADEEVVVINPAIQVVKSSDAPEAGVPVGTLVNYTFTVTNTGDVTLFGISVDDDHLGHIGDIAELAPGASQVLTASAVLNETTTNVVVAVGYDELENQVSDSDELTVRTFLPFTPPDLAIDKVADKDSAQPGDVVEYTLTYRNVGQGGASDFTIVDNYDERYVTVVDAGGGIVADGEITWSIAGPLLPGESATITYKVKVKSDMPSGSTNVDNVVVISHPDDPDTSNNTDTERVVVRVNAPFLPFTGAEALLLVALAVAVGLVGLGVRRLSRVYG